VHLFQDGDVFLGWPAAEPAQAGHGVIHPRVTGDWCFSHGPFGIMVLIFISCTLLARAAVAAGLARAAVAAGLARAAVAAGRWVFVGHMRYPPAGTLPSDADKSEARMATVEECREALQTLTARLGEINPQERSSFFSNRSFSCHVTDLGVTFVTTITDTGAEPVKEAAPDEPPADIRLTANSDDVISLAATPANIARMWMAGRVQVQASIRDLLALRRLL